MKPRETVTEVLIRMGLPSEMAHAAVAAVKVSVALSVIAICLGLLVDFEGSKIVLYLGIANLLALGILWVGYLMVSDPNEEYGSVEEVEYYREMLPKHMRGVIPKFKDPDKR